MPVGLALPVGVSSSGGARLVSSDENNNKIIALALGSDDNENAFQQDIGLGDFMVFSVEDPTVRGKIMGRMRKIFQRFQAQKRFRLLTETVEWFPDSENQDLVLQFKYHDLESDEIKTFSKTLESEL